MDRVRNDEVRRRAGVVRELAKQAKQGVLQCFGYVERMEEECFVKMITRSDVRGERPRGRPPIGWMDSVKSVRCKSDVRGARKSACT